MICRNTETRESRWEAPDAALQDLKQASRQAHCALHMLRVAPQMQLLAMSSAHAQLLTFIWRQTTADQFFSSGSGDRADGESGSTSVQTSSTGKGNEELLDALRAALQQDGSGMLFNETARQLRGDGVFSNEFFDHLTALANAAGDDAERCVCHIARVVLPL